MHRQVVTGVMAATSLALLPVLGDPGPAEGAALRQFHHASTCGDYEMYASSPGKSRIASTTAVVGHWQYDDSGCGSEVAYGKWISDHVRTTAVFRWFLGDRIIRRAVHYRCGDSDGCRDTLRWTHAFTINSDGIRHYNGKRLTVKVTFRADGWATKSLRTDPANDSGYYTHVCC